MDTKLEQEIVGLRSQIKTVEADAARERSGADKLVSDIREAGASPFDGDNFAKVDEAYKASDGLRDEAVQLRSRLERALTIAGEKVDAGRASTEELREVARSASSSLGARFAGHESMAALRSSGVLDSGMARIETRPIELASRDELMDGLRFRTTIDNSASSGGGVVWSDRKEDLIVAKPVRKVRLLDVITMGLQTQNAAETTYGTAAPESAYGFTKQNTTTKRLPHFVPATKGVLNDAGQLRTLIDSRLMLGLNLRAELQVLNGDGTGENFKGITATAGIGTQAKSTDTRVDAVHKAVTNVRLNYLFNDPSVIGLHPTDYESIVLEKDADGNYTHGRPISELNTLWGMTPVVSPVFTQGTALVGDYTQAIMWLRAGIAISASDSHNDFFIKGLVAVLAELRAAFAVLQPAAFCKVTGL
jgi:HK97 family phage major capsid protein